MTVQADSDTAVKTEKSGEQFLFGTWYPRATLGNDIEDGFTAIILSKCRGYDAEVVVATWNRAGMIWAHQSEGYSDRFVTHWMPRPPPCFGDRSDEPKSTDSE